MSIIRVEKLNEVHSRIFSDASIERELVDHFTYAYPGAKWTPAFKAKLWDGLIKLYNPLTKTLYNGLIKYVESFAVDNEYTVEGVLRTSNDISHKLISSFTNSLNLYGRGEPIIIRDYQIDAIQKALNEDRALLLSPTASGKSLIIYTIIRWHIKAGRKILLTVPTTALCEQMYTDFEDYSSNNSFDVEENCQKLYSGFSKVFERNVMVSTWQSIYKQPKQWFKQFDCIIGDEAHLFQAKSLTSIMEKMDDVKYRIGTTGTINNKLCHQLVLEGIFGPLHKVTTTKKLMDNNHVVQLNITCLLLKYNEEVCKSLVKLEYQKEMDFIVSFGLRNKFICNLALNTNGNTLILFQYVEKHGKILYDIIKEKATKGRKVYFIHGKVEAEDREIVRKLVEEEKDSVIIASFGTMSTGTNVPSIENIIFASPSKSKIRNLQSIGRGLRLNDNKTECNLYDLADDFSYKKYRNHTLKHAAERYKIYAEEEFKIKLVEVKIC